MIYPFTPNLGYTRKTYISRSAFTQSKWPHRAATSSGVHLSDVLFSGLVMLEGTRLESVGDEFLLFVGALRSVFGFSFGVASIAGVQENTRACSLLVMMLPLLLCSWLLEIR